MMEPTFSIAFVASHFGISTPGWVWGFNMESLVEIAWFFLNCGGIMLASLGIYCLLRRAHDVFIERIRWWK
jgi:hypothetical protein